MMRKYEQFQDIFLGYDSHFSNSKKARYLLAHQCLGYNRNSLYLNQSEQELNWILVFILSYKNDKPTESTV